MNEPGTLIRCDEALDLIRSTADPALRNFLDMAFTAFVKGRYAGHRDGLAPNADFDMLFCMAILQRAFSDRDYLWRLLSGGEPERWFDDQGQDAAGHALDTSAPLIPRADVATP
jgi:hypothetical protein